jgi:branched-chain amino acid transport system substrate-binding protein
MRLRYIVCVFLIVLAGCGDKENVVKIGFASPLTGDQAKMGIDSLNGVKLAIEQANARGDIIPGYKVEVEALDDQHNPSQAVNVAKRLVADANVLAVVGHFNSSCTMPASAVYHEAQMAQITHASTNPAISRQGFNTFFRIASTDDVQGPRAANYVTNVLGAKRIFVLDDKTTYGQGLADEFDKQARANGLEVLGHEGITQGDKDFSPLLTKIKPLNPDLIYFGGIYPEGALLLRQARGLQLTSEFMGGDGIVEPTFVKLATPTIADGSYGTMVGGDLRKEPAAQEFIKTYEAKYGPIGIWTAYAYDATNIVLDAIRRAGKKDRKAVLEAMLETKDFPGVTGVTNFDYKGDNENAFIGIYQVRNGKWEFQAKAE